LFRFLEGGEVEIQAAYPARVIGSPAENLRAAAGGEHYEWESMYPRFAAVAREEGLTDIAKVFGAVAVAEKQHEKRYLDLLANVEAPANQPCLRRSAGALGAGGRGLVAVLRGAWRAE
jgi:rubrerythrin